jgi:hypothetical protein
MGNRPDGGGHGLTLVVMAHRHHSHRWRLQLGYAGCPVKSRKGGGTVALSLVK